MPARAPKDLFDELNKVGMRFLLEILINRQYFIHNFLWSKYKHSKSIIKGLIKSKLWKEQTGWKLGTAFNNNNNDNKKQ